MDGGKKTIVVSGVTGELGSRIAHYLIEKGVIVKGIIREGSTAPAIKELRDKGIIISQLNYNDPIALWKVCEGADCVISALSGVHDVIVTAQKQLLDAAVSAKVPRFIPSDFCIDFTKIEPGSNRNLDFRREFAELLDKAPIKATSILNGMFTDLLKGQAPVVSSSLKRIVFWGNANQMMDFTTIENTAAFTAAAAIDYETPRFLRISGEEASPRDLKKSAEDASGQRFKLLRVGGLGFLKAMIKFTRAIMPKKEEVFPPWQGMQYLHNMFTGLPKLTPLDNNRYPGMHWTKISEVLAERE